MRRVVLSCMCLAVVLLPDTASARVAPPHAKPGYLVVRKALNDGGPNGHPAVTLVVRGFVLGRITQEARVDIYHLPSSSTQTLPSAKGQDVKSRSRRWRGLPGVEYTGSGFRFSAVGGSYRVVIRGAGVYLFAGGVQGTVKLRGSSRYPRADGTYAIDASAPRSMPARAVKRGFGSQ
jgi:hypothetical protein